MQSFSNDPIVIRQMILERYESPFCKIEIEQEKELQNYKKYNHKSESCIDNITVYLKQENKIIVDAKFSGIGCAISTASTDILCELIVGKNEIEIFSILDNYYNMIKQEKYDLTKIGDLYIFQNVGNQMNRIKCALVGVDSIKNILKNNDMKE